MIELMAITDDPALGRSYTDAGVSRIMIDLETYGKAGRQAHRDTVKSDHSSASVAHMREVLPTGDIVVRCEPAALPGWTEHVEEILRHAPTAIMLPMVETPAEVRRLVDVVDDRADLIVMIETVNALSAVDDIVDAAPTATFFVGLNDLHIQLGDRFMFEPLANGHVETAAMAARRRGARFGFGGLARPGHGKVDAVDIVGEHVRLGSTLTILARSFFQALGDAADVGEIEAEIAKLRQAERIAAERSQEQQEADRLAICRAIHAVAAEVGNAST